MSNSSQLGPTEKFKKLFTNIKDRIKGSALIKEIWFWVSVSFFVLLLYIIITIFNITAPKQNEATCILRGDFGQSSIVELNVSDFDFIGNEPDNGPYFSVGQQTNWLETDYKTNGKPLKVFVYGKWFPWGENATNKKKNVDYIMMQNHTEETLVPISNDDYYVCPMNTDVFNGEDVNSIEKYKLQTFIDSSFTSNAILSGFANPYNRFLSSYYGTAHKEMSHCIKEFNCSKTDITSTTGSNPKCALANGMGVYMKIGENSEYAYHIANESVPKFDVQCFKDITTNSNKCQYNYILDKNRNIVYTQIPFTLPAMIFDVFKYDNGDISDIRTSIDNLIDIASQNIDIKYQTLYEFIKYTKDSQNTSCSGNQTSKNGSIITSFFINNGICYKSEVNKINYNNIDNLCLRDLNGNIKLVNIPNELCPPASDQKIFLKFSTTNFDIADGKVKIVFAEGVQKNKKLGISLSFIQELFYTVIGPLWGNQKNDAPIEIKNISYNTGGDMVIEFKASVFITQRNNNIYIKGTPDDSGGIIVILYNSNRDILESIGNGISHTYDKINNTLTISDTSGSLKDRVELQTIESTRNEFFRVSNMTNGLFTIIRNMILNHETFQQLRIIFIVLFSMQYGYGLFTGTKKITFDNVLKDIVRFGFLVWATQPSNYILIDKILLPLFLKTCISISGILISSLANVYGTSVTSDNPYEFYDTIIQMFLSKAFFIKQMALSLDKFYLHFIIFPLLIIGVKNIIKVVIGNILGLILILVKLGGMLSFFPFFLLLSMTEWRKDAFEKWFIQMRNEFLNLGISLSIFGLFFGLIVKQAFDLINIEVCYKVFWGNQTLGIGLSKWTLTNNGITSSEIIFKLAIFWMSSQFLQQLSQVSNDIANQFIGSGGLGINMQAGNKAVSDYIFSNIPNVSTILGGVKDFKNFVNNGIKKNNMDSVDKMMKYNQLLKEARDKIITDTEKKKNISNKELQNAKRKVEQLNKEIGKTTQNIQKQAKKSGLKKQFEDAQNRRDNLSNEIDQDNEKRRKILNRIKKLNHEINNYENDLLSKNITPQEKQNINNQIKKKKNEIKIFNQYLKESQKNIQEKEKKLKYLSEHLPINDIKEIKDQNIVSNNNKNKVVRPQIVSNNIAAETTKKDNNIPVVKDDPITIDIPKEITDPTKRAYIPRVNTLQNLNRNNIKTIDNINRDSNVQIPIDTEKKPISDFTNQKNLSDSKNEYNKMLDLERQIQKNKSPQIKEIPNKDSHPTINRPLTSGPLNIDRNSAIGNTTINAPQINNTGVLHGDIMNQNESSNNQNFDKDKLLEIRQKQEENLEKTEKAHKIKDALEKIKETKGDLDEPDNW